MAVVRLLAAASCRRAGRRRRLLGQLETSGIKREEMERGQSWPNRLRQAPHQVHRQRLRPDQGGGRPSHPLLTGYRPQFYVRTTDVTGAISLPGGRDIMPGDNVEMSVELITPISIKTACGSPSARVAGRSAPASSHGRVATQIWPKSKARPAIQLACTECKERTYTTRKNKKNDPNRLELMKYCPRDRRHTLHREAK